LHQKSFDYHTGDTVHTKVHTHTTAECEDARSVTGALHRARVTRTSTGLAFFKKVKLAAEKSY
jgi:hypothetical protein